jgi:16S rRNA G966 N2-methylase RsmD
MKCLTIQINGNQCLREGTYSDSKCGYHTKTQIKKITPKPKTIRSQAVKEILEKHQSSKKSRPTRVLRVSKIRDSIEIYKEQAILKKEYPYKRFYLNINKLLKEAKVFKPEFATGERKLKTIERINAKKYKDDYVIIYTAFGDDYPEINNITDFYTEKCRLECRRETTPRSPIELYNKMKYKLFNEAKQNFGAVTFEKFNNFLDKSIDNCTNYKLSYLLGIMDFFKPKKWLDMSAGWGDRLMSAIISGVKRYVGVDPNPCMQPYYKQMVQDLIPYNEQNNYEVILGKAEDVKLPNETFDFIFTSPPFFTFEIYNEKGINKELQSTFNFKTVNDWLKNFLYKMIDNAWNHLEVGGNFVLYIEDKPGYRFISSMIKYFESKPGSVYDGIIYQVPYSMKYGNIGKKGHTLYCWHRK